MAQRESRIGQGSSPVVTQLLILNGVAFLFMLVAPVFVLENFALWPMVDEAAMELPAAMPRGEFYPWQLVTYAFLHGGFFHLAINMFVLWMFSKPIEQQWGSRVFAFFYFFCIIGTGLVQLLIASSGLFDPAPTVGASGGVFAILLVFGIMFPDEIVLLIFPPIPMKAKYFVIFIGIIELMAGVFGTSPGIANFAHLAGMLLALLFIMLFRSRLSFPPRR